MQRRYILSIDGGGVRGIIPALALMKLEQTTNRPARETFSFVAGTSTGALLASAVAAGIPAATMVQIYKTRLKDIFKPGPPWNAMRRYTAGYMYDSANLNRVLREEFGSLAGWRLNDSPIDILFTATGLADGKPWYFVRDNPQTAGSTGRLSLRHGQRGRSHLFRSVAHAGPGRRKTGGWRRRRDRQPGLPGVRGGFLL
jgi:hypothetical protein